MKVNKDKTENCQVFLTIEMEPSEVEVALQKSYSKLVKKANVPGFRKGKAPRELLERYLGKDALFNEALEHMIPEAYDNAIHEQNIEAFAQPQIEIVQTEPLVFTTFSSFSISSNTPIFIAIDIHYTIFLFLVLLTYYFQNSKKGYEVRFRSRSSLVELD